MRASDGKMRLVIVSLTFGLRYSRLGIATDLSVFICRMLVKFKTSFLLSFVRQKSQIFLQFLSLNRIFLLYLTMSSAFLR